jgi:hypothetical protein
VTGLRLALVFGMAMMLLGCERRQAVSVATTQNASAQQHATTTPATTQASPSFIWIDQQSYEFPPARLVLRNKDDHVVALLFSVDPPNAINDNYTGNSYFLEMPDLEIAEGSTLAGASWSYKAPNSEREESVSGIFLQGRRIQLQPFDVRVEFDGAVSPVTVRLAGTFLKFEGDEAAADKTPGTLVTVRTELSAEVRTKTSAKN